MCFSQTLVNIFLISQKKVERGILRVCVSSQTLYRTVEMRWDKKPQSFLIEELLM